MESNCIKHSEKNGIKESKSLKTDKVDSALSKKKLNKRHKRDQREEDDGDQRSGRPKSSTSKDVVKAVKKMIKRNPDISIREVASNLGISVGSSHAIVSRLKKANVGRGKPEMCYVKHPKRTLSKIKANQNRSIKMEPDDQQETDEES